ncbi:hypothetical protein AJ80_03893 [Polytolypa hystricis UAMH7299]|uniref:Cupin type-1 domain-containing protein n=1 Tax=Polytolypa hystricis (strain UAMH7299) TaxID=1447883 RepID=A0A2B7YG24_POLH7|nr:hypothetical protein AJ80_03893 [Polytolypa hystricis UAMH7299]
MSSLSTLFTALLAAVSLASATPLVRRTAAGNPNLITQLRTSTQVNRTNALIEDEPDFSNFKFNFLEKLKPGPFGGGVVVANGETFPAVTGTGISGGVVFLPPCGMNGAHTHPRASEFAIASNATVKTGYVMENGAAKFIDLTLNPLEGVVFPQGSIHFQFNDNCDPTMLFVGLSSEDPGTSFAVKNVFALGNPAASAALGLPDKINDQNLEAFTDSLPTGIILGAKECAKRCKIDGAPMIKDSN